jgi:hypothetical protein
MTLDDSVHCFAVVTCCHVRSKCVSDEGCGSPTQVSKESKHVDARGNVKTARTGLCLYHTDCTPCFPVWQSTFLRTEWTSCWLHHSTLLPATFFLCFSNNLHTKPPFNCSNRFTFFAWFAIFHIKVKIWNERISRTGKQFCSPKLSYRLWDPLILYFHDVPRLFPEVRRTKREVFHSPLSTTEVVIQ